MPRIAILGGGIAGLAAAFECEQQRQAGHPLDWHLFEASDTLGGTVSTTRLHTPDGPWILEDGPDGWVTEKPWARHLAEELGLGPDLIPCNEATRQTWLWLNQELTSMPPRMRLMVPDGLEALAALSTSPLFSAGAKQAYQAELARAAELRAAAPHADESVASFVLRHFGPEVLARIAAPLLSGVFGGDVHRLSVRAVMPQFVLMEAEHGSLIAALEARSLTRGNSPQQPTFTSLRQGMGSLVEALVAALPPDSLHTGNRASALQLAPRPTPGSHWLVRFTGPATAGCSIGLVPFDELLLATPPAVTAALLHPTDPVAASLIPTQASSAVLATFCWPPALATFDLPPGFGFLVPRADSGNLAAILPSISESAPEPPTQASFRPEGEARSGGPPVSHTSTSSTTPQPNPEPHPAPPSSRPEGEARSGETPVAHTSTSSTTPQSNPEPHPIPPSSRPEGEARSGETPVFRTATSGDGNLPRILAGTFTAQKFPYRAPAGAHVVRVFFSGHLADTLQTQPDTHIAALALAELRRVLPHLPDPDPTLTTVRRWPRSLPQYEVGHLDRMAQLQKHVHALGHLHLLGNGYHGVGVPDLIRDARNAAKSLLHASKP